MRWSHPERDVQQAASVATGLGPILPVRADADTYRDRGGTPDQQQDGIGRSSGAAPQPESRAGC